MLVKNRSDDLCSHRLGRRQKKLIDNSVLAVSHGGIRHIAESRNLPEPFSKRRDHGLIRQASQLAIPETSPVDGPRRKPPAATNHRPKICSSVQCPPAALSQARAISRFGSCP